MKELQKEHLMVMQKALPMGRLMDLSMDSPMDNQMAHLMAMQKALPMGKLMDPKMES